MTRGGKRSPVGGRPKSKGETKTANLCGVRVTPSHLELYQRLAGMENMTLSAWVQMYLQEGRWLLPAGERALRIVGQLEAMLEGDASVVFDLHAVKDVIQSLSESIARCRKFQKNTHADVACPHCGVEQFEPKRDKALVVCIGCHEIFHVGDAAK